MTTVEPVLSRTGDFSTFLAEEREDDTYEPLRRAEAVGRPVGAGDFIAGLEKRLGRRLFPQKRGPKSKKGKSIRFAQPQSLIVSYTVTRNYRHEPALSIRAKLPLPKGFAPGKKLLNRNSMPTRCRRNLPWTRVTFLDDPKLRGLRPTTPTPCINHLKTADLMTVRNDIHTDSQLQIGPSRKAVETGGLRSRKRSLRCIWPVYRSAVLRTSPKLCGVRV